MTSPLPPPEKPRIVVRSSQVEARLAGSAVRGHGLLKACVWLLLLGGLVSAAWYMREDWLVFLPIPAADSPAEKSAAPPPHGETLAEPIPAEPVVEVASVGVVPPAAKGLDFPMPESTAAPAGDAIVTEPAAWREPYQQAVAAYNAAVSNYTLVTTDHTRHAALRDAEQQAAAAIQQFRSLQGQTPPEIPLSRRLADAESLLKSTREMHRFLVLPADNAGVTRPPAPRLNVGPTRTAPPTRSAPPPRSAPQTPQTSSR